MAQRGGLLYSLFGEGLREAVWTILRSFWPVVMPMLTAVGQYFTAVPWPYFFTALSITVAAAVWSIVQLRLWIEATRIDDKVTVVVADVRQMSMDTAENLYIYQLMFAIMNGSEKLLFVDLKKITWEIGNSRPKDMVTIEEDVAALPKGTMVVGSPTIEGVPAGHHTGKFTITVHYGPDQDDMQYEIFLSGTFRLLEAAEIPDMHAPLFRWNRMKYEVRRL